MPNFRSRDLGFFLPAASSRDVTFKCSDGSEMLVLSCDAGRIRGKSPGVIVIHEAYGLNPQIRGVAKRYAEHGFVAIAPNLFSRNSDIMNEKNIESAMRVMWTLPPEKRSDPNIIPELMKTMSETDRQVMQILFPRSRRNGESDGAGFYELYGLFQKPRFSEWRKAGGNRSFALAAGSRIRSPRCTPFQPRFLTME